MQKLIMNKLGPIERCELQCSQFMAFTGFQASGKSTIAKASYYFRAIKEDIVELDESRLWKLFLREDRITGGARGGVRN